MPIACHAYYTVRDRLRAFLRVSRPQLTNLSLLTFGLFAAGNSPLPRIAAKLPRCQTAAAHRGRQSDPAPAPPADERSH